MLEGSDRNTVAVYALEGGYYNLKEFHASELADESGAVSRLLEMQKAEALAEEFRSRKPTLRDARFAHLHAE